MNKKRHSLYLWKLLPALAVISASLPSSAQTPSTAARVGKLEIVIVEDEDAINNLKTRTAREPIVEVRDSNHRPVAGAAVIFATPRSGPTGIFGNGSHVLHVVSNEQGRAVANGLRPNNVQGVYKIKVNASFHGDKTSTVTSQVNSLSAGVMDTSVASSVGGTGAAASGGVLGTGLSWLAVGGIAGGVASAAVLAKVLTNNNGNNTINTPPPVSGTIGNPGPPVFGPTGANSARLNISNYRNIFGLPRLDAVPVVKPPTRSLLAGVTTGPISPPAQSWLFQPGSPALRGSVNPKLFGIAPAFRRTPFSVKLSAAPPPEGRSVPRWAAGHLAATRAAGFVTNHFTVVSPPRPGNLRTMPVRPSVR